MTPAIRLVAAAAATLLAGASHAATTVYTDIDSFVDALSGAAFVQTFNGFASSSDAFSFAGLGYAYTMSAPSYMFASGRDVGTNQPEEVLTITFTGNPVTAVGGNFFAANYSSVFEANEPLYITVNSGSGPLSAVLYQPVAKSNFLGFTSSTPITSVTLEIAFPFFGNYATVDNLVVGSVPVPEPGQWALMALGLGALGWRLRRRAA